MSHIFLSYSRKDSKEVEELVQGLKEAGYNPWLDRSGIGGGEVWDDRITQAIIECDAFVILLSPNSIKSENVKDEINFAKDKSKRIIPVRIKQVELPDGLHLRLARFQIIDLVESKELDHLIESLGGRKTLIPESLKEPISEKARLFRFYTRDDLGELITQSGKMSKVESFIGALPLLQTKKQHTWLAVTNEQLFCMLDDQKTREKGTLIQWNMPLKNANPICTRLGKRNRTVVDIGIKKGWLYSRTLYPNNTELEGAIKELILRGTQWNMK